MTQATQAYQLLQKLTDDKNAPAGEDFQVWTFRCIEALTNKILDLELEVSKLKVKNGTSK